MLCGMTYQGYWNATMEEKETYLKFHELRNEQRNQEMWLQGLYVFKAIETALHNQPAFATHPVKPESYLKEPIRLTPLTEEEKRQKEQAKLDQFVNELLTFQENWERKYGKRNPTTESCG